MNDQTPRSARLLGITILLLSAIGCASDPRQPPLAAPPPVPPPVAVEPDAGLRAEAERELRSAAAADDPIVRANAAEAAGPVVPEVAVDLLADPDPRVRFAAAMTVGRQRIDRPGVRDRLAEMAEGGSPNGRVAAAFALHRLGDTSRSQRLVRLATDPRADPVVRAHAATALGLTGEPSAAAALRRAAEDPDATVRLAAAEGLWRLGDVEALRLLLSASLSQYGDDSVFGTAGLAARRDPRSVAALRGKLTDDYPEVALAAARGLGEIGSDDGYGVALRDADDPEARRRLMAAAALAEIGRPDAQATLAKLVKDPDPRVRVAAASAVLRLRHDEAVVASDTP